MEKMLLKDLILATESHFREKGYSEKTLKRLKSIWNRFARYSTDQYFSMEQGISFLWDAYQIEWAEFPPPMIRYKRRSMSAIRFYEILNKMGK